MVASEIVIVKKHTMSNALNQIPVDKTWSPMESSRKLDRKYSRVHLNYLNSNTTYCLSDGLHITGGLYDWLIGP